LFIHLFRVFLEYYQNFSITTDSYCKTIIFIFQYPSLIISDASFTRKKAIISTSLVKALKQALFFRY